MNELLQEAFETLDPREQAILTLRFGLGDVEHPRTLKNTGAHYNISGERARSIQNTALAKIKKYIKKNQ